MPGSPIDVKLLTLGSAKVGDPRPRVPCIELVPTQVDLYAAVLHIPVVAREMPPVVRQTALQQIVLQIEARQALHAFAPAVEGG